MKQQLTLLLLALLSSVTLCSSLTINVTANGKDTKSCLDGYSDCLFLGYALGALDGSASEVTINVFYNHELRLHNDSNFKFHGVQNVNIWGHPAVAGGEDQYITITCPGMGAGLYFNHSTNISFRHLSWVNCGTWHPTSANGNWTNCSPSDHTCKGLVLPSAVSTIFMFNCTNLFLEHTRFTSNRGSGVSLYNVVGVVNIIDSTFFNHSTKGMAPCYSMVSGRTSTCSPQSTGLYIEFTYCPEFTKRCYPDITSIERTNYNIINCNFTENKNLGVYRNITDTPTPMELDHWHHWPFGRGGGLGISLRSFILKHFTIDISKSSFINNSAVYGGGMYLLLQSGYPDHTYYDLLNNTFKNNMADYNGGGLCVEIDVLYSTHNVTFILWLRNFLYIGQTNFLDNYAYWGGGMSFTAYPLNVSYIDFNIVSCVYSHNKYSGGGGAVALLRKEKPEKEYYFIASASFYACEFSNTLSTLAKSASVRTMCSSVHSEGITLSFYNVTKFENNCASALRLSDTGATFYDIVLFINNTGFNGGGVSLRGKSWITLRNGVKINFTNNTANQYGGAIYYDPSPIMYMNMTSSCFVWYEMTGNEDVPVNMWRVGVIFTGNKACQAGHAAYITDPKQCLWPRELSLFDPRRRDVFNYSGQVQDEVRHVVATSAVSLEIISDNRGKYKKPKNSSEYGTYHMMPGEELQVELRPKDSNRLNVTTVITVTCLFRIDYETYKHGEDRCGPSERFNIDQFNRQVTSGALKNFKVYGPSAKSINQTDDVSEDLILVFKTNDPIPVVLPLLVKFSPCMNGYRYSADSKSCKCVQDLSEELSPVVCASTMSSAIETPCVKHNYWYGNVTGEDTQVYHYCQSPKCQPRKDHDRCDNYDGYVTLPNNASLLCSNGLKGPLCTECDDGQDLSYNAYKCVKCNKKDIVGLILLILLECFAIVVIILVFLKLNVRVSTAGFYGFLYFYSILRLFLWIPLPTGLDVVIGLITGITSLDFSLLQYIDLCLFNNVRAIHYETLHYIYPIVIMAMIFLIIKVDQSGWRRSQFFSGHSSTQALCIILLITYTSVSETSLHILLPLHYQKADGSGSSKHWYVSVDPGVRYLDPKHHLPFWLIAVVMEFLCVLPFSLLLLFAPWAMRYVNLSRLKPILDEYHNCFHDDYRWFAGVYLLARQVMFMISALAIFPERTAYIQQIFCLALLVLVATIHPYRSRVLNIIDTLILSLITFLSFSTYNGTARRVYYGQSELQDAFIGIASLAPFVVMVTAVILIGLKKFCKRFIVIKRFSKPLQSVLGERKYDPTSTFTNSESYDRVTSTLQRKSGFESDDDLPPRFYDQERTHLEETTPLLKNSTPYRHGINSIQYRPVPQEQHSINKKPATN